MDTASTLTASTPPTSALPLPARHANNAQPSQEGRFELAGSSAFEGALQAALPRRALLPVQAIKELAELARHRRCQAGDVLARRGQVAGACWLLGSGSVALGVLGAQGVLAHVRTMQRQGWLDLSSVLLDDTHVEDVVCETTAELWQLPAAPLRACCARHPALMSALALSLAKGVQQLTLEARVLMTKDVQARCATWLLEHAQPNMPVDGTPTAGVALNQRKRSVALQLGTTPETFSRVLSQLRSKGLIEVQGYRITLLDLAALRKVAGV